MISIAMCSFVAMAQSGIQPVEFTPQSGKELATLDETIKVVLNGDAAEAAIAVVQTIGGYSSINFLMPAI